MITFLGHAQLFISAEDKNLLLDPWFTEPVFGGAWWRYPPPPFPDAASLPQEPDLLLLSHIHPDHSGVGTLKQLDRHGLTAAMRFPSGLLHRRLERCGYDNVVSPAPWETNELLPGVRVTFVPHDRGWEVSSIVIESEGVRIYHGNDNTLSVEAYAEVRERLGEIDAAFLPFAGASSYPTGFDWDRDTILAKGREKKAQGVKRLTDGIAGLKPKHAIPFASSWALLEESELWKNYLDRPNAREAAEAAADVAQEAGTELLVLEPGDEWSPDGVKHNHRCEGWASDNESVRRYAAQRAGDVARAAVPPAPADDILASAFEEYFAEMLADTRNGTAQLDMVAGFRAGGTALQWHIVFAPGHAPRLHAGAADDADEVLTLSAAELWELLTTPANWEDPWYGYRLQVHKREGAGYYRAFWEMLLNFDDEALSARLATAYRRPA